MDRERIILPEQDTENSDLLTVTDQTVTEQEKKEAQTETDATFSELLAEEDGQGDCPAGSETLPERDAGLSEETDLALFETEEEYDNQPAAADERTVKELQAKESRYIQNVVSQDREQFRVRKHQYHGTSTRDDNLITAWAYIKAAKQNHTILDNARIVGVEEVRMNGESEILARCELTFENANADPTKFYAYMKLCELFVNMPSRTVRGREQTQASYASRCKALVSYMFEAEIPVTVTQALYLRDKARPFQIFVSRREAILRNAASFFIPNDTTHEALTNPGDIVRAKVVSVGAFNVAVNVRGIDCTVNAFDLTYYPVTNCRSYFKVNQEIPVQITDISWPEDSRHKVMLCADYDDLKNTIENKKKNNPEYMRASERMNYNRIVTLPEIKINGAKYEAIRNYEKYSSEIRVGMLVQATVTYVTYSEWYNRPNIHLYLDDFKLAGRADSVNYSRLVGSLAPGVQVTFRISGVYPSGTPYITGRIMNIIPTRER